MALGGSPHHCCLAVHFVACVDDGAVGQQYFYGVRVAGAGGRHQHALALGQGRVGVRSGT